MQKTSFLLIVVLVVFWQALTSVMALATSTTTQSDTTIVTTTVDVAASTIVAATDTATTSTSFLPAVLLSELVVVPVDQEIEWIEVYNLSEVPAVLDGWSLWDGAGKILNVTGTIGVRSYRSMNMPRSVFNNSGDTVILRNANGDIVDEIIYGNWLGASVSTTATGEALMRSAGAMNTSSPFLVTAHPTKGSANLLVEPVLSLVMASSTPATTALSSFDAQQVEPGSVLINEFVSDPADEEREFVELVNTKNIPVDITGWYIEDGSETKTMLEGSITPFGYLVIDAPKGALNNTGDVIILYGPRGEMVDHVLYGNWNGGVDARVAAPKDPESASRGLGDQGQNFFLTKTVTKGAENSIDVLVFSPVANEYPKTVRISELFPNPKGTDTTAEFIELHNIGTETVTMAGWSLGDTSKTRFVFATTTIYPNAYVAVPRSESRISLNNSGKESVTLFGPDGDVVDMVQYDGTVPEEQSYVRAEQTRLMLTRRITPGAENIVETPNNPPDVHILAPESVPAGQVVVLDASDTVDPEQDPLQFEWHLQKNVLSGEIVTTTFLLPGKYPIALDVTDGAGNVKKKTVTILVEEAVEPFQIAEVVSATGTLIYEFYPDPPGSDGDGEFIELFHAGNNTVDLSNMYLDDAEGGSKPYRIPVGTVMSPGMYAVFDRSLTGISLNNSSDMVRLLLPDKTVYEEISYADSVGGAVYMKDELGNWMWSVQPTPGAINAYVSSTVDTVNKKQKKTKEGKRIMPITISGILDEDIGDLVEIEGIVSAAPGLIGKQYFYISDKAGVLISVPKKHIPAVAVGDVVRVTGEIVEVNKERRIKTAKAEDVVIVRRGTAPQAAEYDIAGLSRDMAGTIVIVAGEITESKGTYAYIDDGTEELKVYFSRGAGIKQTLKVGDEARIVGVLHPVKDGVQLYPREMADIQVLATATASVEEIAYEKERDRELSPKMPIILATGTILVGASVFVRKKFFTKHTI